MYKFLFFISLGVNTVVLALNLVDQEVQGPVHTITTEVYKDKSSLEVIDEKSVSPKKDKRIRAKQKTKEDLQIEEIKEELYQSKVDMIHFNFSFFFSKNQLELSEEELDTVVIALIKNPPTYTCDCELPVGFVDFKHSLLKKGFDLTSAEAITDMLTKQKFYDNLNSNILHGVYQEDMYPLVYELHQMRESYQEIKREKVYSKPLGSFDDIYYYTMDFEDAKLEQIFDDPFAEDDLFSTYPILEEISEEEFKALRLTNIKNFEDSLTQDGQELYQNTMSILGNYLDVDDKMRLRVLDFIERNIFYGH